MINLADKVIVVTGGSGLIGSQIIKLLMELKANVINIDVHDGKLGCTFVSMDITKETSIRETFDYLNAHYTTINGWVNSAYPRTKDWGNKVEQIEFDSWRTNVDWHLNGYFFTSKLIAEKMASQGYGSLVNISSIYGIVGPDFTVYDGTSMTMPAAYSAIKAGIINMDRYLAAYFGKKGVRVNTVSPGGIFDHQPEKFVENYNQKVPMGRMGLPIEIANGVAFLLSDAASYITGHNLVIDGGWTAI